MEQLSKENPEQFKIYYTLDNPPKENWTQGTGFVSQKMVKENIPAPSDDVLVLVCGPGGYDIFFSVNKFIIIIIICSYS